MVKTKKKVKVQTKPSKKKQELTRLGAALRSLGGLGGGALGSLVGQSGYGSSIGSGLGATLSKWLGSGDYSVASNTVIQRTLKSSNSIPSMHNSDQSVIIRHKEFLCEVKGSIDFKVQRFFPLQVGDGNTFPWLHTIAQGFQQYRIKGLVYHYVPSSGHAVSSTDPALGTVMIQTSYRANDSNPTSKLEMLNEYWSSESVPSEAFCHPVECDPKENPFNIHYVRSKAIPTQDSPLMYDLGVTYVATSGQQANDKVLGDLWITYEVELKKPLIKSNVTSPITIATLTYASPTTTNLFGTALSATGDSNLQVTANNRTIIFPAGTVGRFLVHVIVNAATSFTGQVDLGGTPSLTNCSIAPFTADGDSSVRSFTTTGATTINTFFTLGIDIVNANTAATLVFGTASWTGTASKTTVTITQLAV